MRTIHVVYHQYTHKNWGAQSPDLPGYIAGAESFKKLRKMVYEGIPFFLGEPAEIIEIFEDRAKEKTA
jgi:predicted RNase H-like HicB family nuclease